MHAESHSSHFLVGKQRTSSVVRVNNLHYRAIVSKRYCYVSTMRLPASITVSSPCEYCSAIDSLLANRGDRYVIEYRVSVRDLSRWYVAARHELEDILTEYRDHEAARWNVDVRRERALIRAEVRSRIRRVRKAAAALRAGREKLT
jgi:hypothetical protein